MAGIEEDKAREYRISMEAVVDANGPEEQAMGWYCYLEDKIAFPFDGTCHAERAISPLMLGEEVEVEAMAPEDECQAEMFVMVRWTDRLFGVPLAQLEPMTADPQTAEAVGDWHYWVKRGYTIR
ncbi:MAG: calcium-binding protein [bacterium]|nr:calcium-binding protein [bacterium]